MSSGTWSAYSVPLVLVVLAAGTFLIAYREPASGQHERATLVGTSGYEMLRHPSNAHATLVRWTKRGHRRNGGGVVAKEMVDEVVLYASDANWILVKRKGDRWAWVNWHTHRIRKAWGFDNMQKRVPADVADLVHSMRRPRQSYRLLFVCIGVVAMTTALVSVGQKLHQAGRQSPT